MKIVLMAALCAGTWCHAALGEGAPILQFDQMVYDFGKTSQVQSVSGVFKYKNAGDALLKIESAKPSCGCTVAELKPDTLPPGASGELPFTLVPGPYRAIMEKHIAIKSNDPKNPEISLAIKLDYTPLYEVNPITLVPRLAFGATNTELSTTITRSDGKPLGITRLDVSKPWIAATLDPAVQANDATGRIRIIVTREGSPRRFNEYVHVYVSGLTNAPAASIYIYGQVLGEVTIAPEALYWSITDSGKATSDRPEALVTRRITIRSATGKAFELKNPQSTVKGIKLEQVTKEAGTAYELVATLEEFPTATVAGNVSFETSVAAQPRMEIPVIVNVFKP